jgi:hypothetical protein
MRGSRTKTDEINREASRTDRGISEMVHGRKCGARRFSKRFSPVLQGVFSTQEFNAASAYRGLRDYL